MMDTDAEIELEQKVICPKCRTEVILKFVKDKNQTATRCTCSAVIRGKRAGDKIFITSSAKRK